MDSRTDQHQRNNIEILSEQLGLLRITEENASEEIIEIESIDKMLTALVPVVQNKQTVMPKSIIPNLGRFGRNKIKFKD